MRLWVLVALLAVAEGAISQCPCGMTLILMQGLALCSPVEGDALPTCIPKSVNTILLVRGYNPTLRSKYFNGYRLVNHVLINFFNISSIEDDAFATLPRLKLLDIADNSLRTLDFNLFSRNQQLQDFNISNNVIDTLVAPRVPLYALELLSIDHNKIRNVSDNSFGVMSSLTLLNMSFNEIETIHPTAFAGLPSLQLLDLSHNQIESLPPDALRNNPNIVAINVSHNFIQNVPIPLLRNLTSLKRLDVSHNKLTTLDPQLFLLSPLMLMVGGNNQLECSCTLYPFFYMLHMSEVHSCHYKFYMLEIGIAMAKLNCHNSSTALIDSFFDSAEGFNDTTDVAALDGAQPVCGQPTGNGATTYIVIIVVIILLSLISHAYIIFGLTKHSPDPRNGPSGQFSWLRFGRSTNPQPARRDDDVLVRKHGDGEDGDSVNIEAW